MQLTRLQALQMMQEPGVALPSLRRFLGMRKELFEVNQGERQSGLRNPLREGIITATVVIATGGRKVPAGEFEARGPEGDSWAVVNLPHGIRDDEIVTINLFAQNEEGQVLFDAGGNPKRQCSVLMDDKTVIFEPADERAVQIQHAVWGWGRHFHEVSGLPREQARKLTGESVFVEVDHDPNKPFIGLALIKEPNSHHFSTGQAHGHELVVIAHYAAQRHGDGKYKPRAVLFEPRG
jgi:hypothetical protein